MLRHCTTSATAAPARPPARRRKRLEELRQGAARPRFGSLEQIRQSEFVAEVTNAPAGVWVVCHLYQDRRGADVLGGRAGWVFWLFWCAPARMYQVIWLSCCLLSRQTRLGCLASRPVWHGLAQGQRSATPSPGAELGLPATPDPPPARTCALPLCSVQDCAILNQCLEEVAKTYPNTKFVKIVSTGGATAAGGRQPGCQQAARGCAGAC